MNPPLKLRHGDTLATLYDKFNAVIDYLARTRIVAGSGIRVSQLPAGQTIESTATAGGSAAAPAGGMFRVTENGDKVTISGGLATLAGYTPVIVPPGELIRSDYHNMHYVYLVWTYESDNPSYALANSTYDVYIPGQQIYWQLARLHYATTPFAQLWQGGMIDFSTRYYVL
ncbi:MAG: hypothetical protein IJI85_10295 [Clostridia bacterium]|nr:hypothetical protein [Lentisphaeria bacterium]MBR0422949.1 hypothetical protein [Clostridia bacterium]